MYKRNHLIFSLIFLLMFFINCKNDGSDTNPDPVIPNPILPKINVTVDKSVKYQTIEGFGFFGGADVWWSSPTAVWNDVWAEKVISDLGITIWRNELFPPAIPGAGQDADWGKQKPVVQGLKAKADKYKVNLKFIATVWSPPADLKWECNFSWAGDVNATRQAGNVSTKNGGTLNPNRTTL